MTAEDRQKFEGDPAVGAHRMSHGDYLGWLLFFMSGIRFKQAVVRHTIEQSERVLPPEAEDKGHRRCIEAARRWLEDPTEKNAKAAYTSAWVGTEGAPSYPTATQAGGNGTHASGRSRMPGRSCRMLSCHPGR